MKFHTKGFNKHWKLKFWKSGEWQVIRERLNDLDRGRLPGSQVYNPAPIDMFRVLNSVPPEELRVCFVGQDPYPDPALATGYAFSVGADVQPEDFPPTLVNIFKEYQDDLGFPEPTCGSLLPWVESGVLLWNAYPSVQVGKPGSHHWCEWEYLTREVLERAASQGAIIVYFGRVAQSFAVPGYERQLCTSHPSPLGARHGFLGSKIFTKINMELAYYGVPIIDWRLP